MINQQILKTYLFSFPFSCCSRRQHNPCSVCDNLFHSPYSVRLVLQFPSSVVTSKWINHRFLDFMTLISYHSLAMFTNGSSKKSMFCKLMSETFSQWRVGTQEIREELIITDHSITKNKGIKSHTQTQISTDVLILIKNREAFNEWKVTGNGFKLFSTDTARMVCIIRSEHSLQL